MGGDCSKHPGYWMCAPNTQHVNTLRCLFLAIVRHNGKTRKKRLHSLLFVFSCKGWFKPFMSKTSQIQPSPTEPVQDEISRLSQAVSNNAVTAGGARAPLPSWVTWQQRLTRLLRAPQQRDFLPEFEQLFAALSIYAQKHPDAALLALVQMSAEETHFYCATHSMLVSVVCMVVARETLRWPENRIQPLGHAALSMNIGMGILQDTLARQREPLSEQQILTISNHATRSEQMLRELGVQDPLWLEAVLWHHQRAPGKLSDRTLGQQMARLIQRADIFGARIAPRVNRSPMSVTSAMQVSYYDETQSVDEAGAALVKALGIYPPGAWVTLASGEIGVVIRRGDKVSTPHVGVMLNAQGMPTGEPLPRDTVFPQWKIVGSVAHDEIRVHVSLEKLLAA